MAAPTNESVTDDERLSGNHVLAPDAGGHHGGLTHITFDLPPTLRYIVHAGGRHMTLQGDVETGSIDWIIDFFFSSSISLHQKRNANAPLSPLCRKGQS